MGIPSEPGGSLLDALFPLVRRRKIGRRTSSNVMKAFIVREKEGGREKEGERARERERVREELCSEDV